MTQYTYAAGDVRRASDLRLRDWHRHSPADIYNMHCARKRADRATNRLVAAMMIGVLALTALSVYWSLT